MEYGTCNVLQLQCTPISLHRSDQLPHFAVEFAASLRKSRVCVSFPILDFSTRKVQDVSD